MNSKQVALAIFLFAIIFFAPFLAIWSLNTLFGIGINYGAWEWLAMFALLGFINASASTKVK